MGYSNRQGLLIKKQIWQKNKRILNKHKNLLHNNKLYLNFQIFTCSKCNNLNYLCNLTFSSDSTLCHNLITITKDQLDSNIIDNKTFKIRISVNINNDNIYRVLRVIFLLIINNKINRMCNYNYNLDNNKAISKECQ